MITARTPKERWALSIWNLKNQIRAEKGEETITDETELAYFVRTNSGRNKQLHELRYEYERRKEELAKIRNEKATEAYWQTEEGAKRFEELNKKREEIIEEARQYRKDAIARINFVVAGLLGDDWGIFNLSDTYTEIGMKDPEKEGRFIFGQDIDVYYDAKHFEKFDREKNVPVYTERFQLNVGSCGSFDAISDDRYEMAAFYIGLGKLLSSKETLEAIKNEMKGYAEVIADKYEMTSAIDRELKNPFETESK